MKRNEITLKQVERLRAHLWRTKPARRVGSEGQALQLIRELGFVLLMPISGADLPSIHQAAGEEWGLWWDWKQTLPGRKACYYAKVLRRRGTFISWQWFPAFYRAYGEPRPYLRLYRDGLLDRLERQILDLLADRGPMMTSELRLAFGPRSKENTRRVKAILVELQTRFLITAAGGDTEGWSHHRWDLVERWVPGGVLRQASHISQQEARGRIIHQFVRNQVAATGGDVCWTFGWERREVIPLIERLVGEGKVQQAWAPELESEVIVPRPWPTLRGGG